MPGHPHQDVDLGQLQTRIAQTYDTVPYASRSFPQTHPGRVAAVATLFGLTPPSVRSASVLEIGCAAGGNLIPLAASDPGGRYLGLELSARQVELAQRRIGDLGLSNIRVIQADVAAFEPKDETFDFIICHGVYSWVPDHVRDAILRLCSQALTDNGIAYVSYNVLPGWRPRQIARDACLIHTSGLTDPDHRLRASRWLLDFLGSRTSTSTAYGAAIKQAAEFLSHCSDDYLFHEFLEIENTPCTFLDFVEAAARHRLAFLGEAEVFGMFPENRGLDLAAQLRDLAGDQVIPLEQYLDILEGRTFRQSLLVRTTAAEAITRRVTPDRLTSLSFGGAVTAAAPSDTGFDHAIRDAAGRELKSKGEAMRHAFEIIIARQPSTTSLDHLRVGFAARDLAMSQEDESIIRDALLKGVIAGLFTASTVDVTVATSLPEHPKAPAFARIEAAEVSQFATNLKHESVNLDVVAQHLLPLLDGTRDRAALRRALLDKVDEGAIRFLRSGARVTDPDDIGQCADEHLDRVLAALLANALIEAPDEAGAVMV